MKKPKKHFKPEVTVAMCKECGYCVEVCSQEVFEPASGLNSSGYHYMVVKHAENCNGCLKCFQICADFAISVEPEEDPARAEATGDQTTSAPGN
jgi:NAD-dependent dihydropyrimidine dehydrogenase PreA subunit